LGAQSHSPAAAAAINYPTVYDESQGLAIKR
jgi:hypothetical protein